MADKNPFKAQDAYQENAMSRREIMEKSHDAAKAMAEMLGQEGQFHSLGAAYGQHSAIPLPKTDEKPQEIKLFLHGKPTVAAQPQTTNADLGYEAAEKLGEAGYVGSFKSDWKETEIQNEEEEEEEELITEILERRLAYLYMSFQPPEQVEGPADTLFIVTRGKEGSGVTRRALIRAHSKVLQRYNDAFNELIGYRQPAPPSSDSENDKEEEQITVSPSHEPKPFAMRKPSQWWRTSTLPSERSDDADNEIKYGGATQWAGDYGDGERWEADADEEVYNEERGTGDYGDGLHWTPNQRDDHRVSLLDGMMDDWQIVDRNNEAKDQGAASTIADGVTSEELSYDQRGSVRFKESEFLKHKRPSADYEFMGRNTRRQSQAFTDDGLMDLGLQHVIGNLQDSQKPLLVKEFLDASSKLVKLPGWEHLPPEVKVPFEKFANSVSNFTTPAAHAAVKALEQEYSTLRDGGGLESNFLGMVGRRESKAMAGILTNITRGVAERKKSSMILAQAKHEDQAGVGKDVSATAARTALERRKSASYLQSQEKRKSILALEPQKSIALIATQDKRITPSFLERRQSKALLEIAQKEKRKSDTDDLNLRRRTSKAAVAAFERKKKMSVLETKSEAEMEFNADFDGGWKGSQKLLPPAKEGRRVSLASLGLSSEIMHEGMDGQARRISTMALDEKSKRKSSVGFLERKGSQALIDMKQMERLASLMKNSPSPSQRRPSQPPPLSHTREEDKDGVVRFYEEEDEDIYATSSSSSEEPEPPQLPKDVVYVIEKRHWTADTLHAILEFIYTEVVHIHCEELPEVYAAANEILLSSLTDSIRLKPIINYFSLAMVNEYNRVALLQLAKQLTTEADFNNYVNSNQDFHQLKKLCEAFTLAEDGPKEKKPYILLFETAHISFRNLPFVTPGLHDINGEMVILPHPSSMFFSKYIWFISIPAEVTILT
ncbi:hypothetical protein R1flu_013392 [Riccia fluitans]|uniref:Uncharacterized protein n=1 Tax=Riccia fluitans TaxID=41844 RepID=A0ABD1YD52_9MARC